MARDRRLLGSTVLLVSLALGLVGLSPASGPALAGVVAPGRITGTVTGAGGAALEGVSVSAYPVNCDHGCDAYGGVTGADGSYAVEGVAPGSYLLLIQKGSSSYIAEYYDNVIEQEAATHVVVTAGTTTAGKNARLETGGHLKGVVTGKAGRELKGITVTVYRKEGGRWQYAGERSTARNGSYDIGGLLSGVYRLRFTDDSEPGYLTEFYKGARVLKDATNIVLGPDEAVMGLDLKLEWPRTMRSIKAPGSPGSPRPERPSGCSPARGLRARSPSRSWAGTPTTSTTTSGRTPRRSRSWAGLWPRCKASSSRSGSGCRHLATPR